MSLKVIFRDSSSRASFPFLLMRPYIDNSKKIDYVTNMNRYAPFFYLGWIFAPNNILAYIDKLLLYILAPAFFTISKQRQIRLSKAFATLFRDL